MAIGRPATCGAMASGLARMSARDGAAIDQALVDPVCKNEQILECPIPFPAP